MMAKMKKKTDEKTVSQEEADKTVEITKKYVDVWTGVLGLRSWECSFFYIYDAEQYPQYFANDEVGKQIMAHVDCDWRYMQLLIAFNVKQMCECSEEKIERIVVHELVHALVNEMRSRGVPHEERVVTQLTSAFIWTKEKQWDS